MEGYNTNILKRIKAKALTEPITVENEKTEEIKPNHYQGKTECKDKIAEVIGCDGLAAFYVGNIIKYVYRYPDTKKENDLAKALTYCNMYHELQSTSFDKLPFSNVVETAELFIIKLHIESK